jgi:putative ABC transport system substrate-binding protein
MLAAMAATWASVWVRAFFAYGISRSIGDGAVLAAKSATSTIPIVFLSGDPAATGFVASLARPGGNLTGVSPLTLELIPKRLELLSELVPQAGVITLLRFE